MRRMTKYATMSCRQLGVTSIEYALLSALIAMVIVVAVTNTGETVGNFFDYVAAQVADAIRL